VVHRADEEVAGAVAAAVVEAEAALVVRRVGERPQRAVLRVEQPETRAQRDDHASVAQQAEAADPRRHLPRQGSPAARLERAQRRGAHVDPVEPLALLVPLRTLAIDGLRGVDQDRTGVRAHASLPCDRSRVARDWQRRRLARPRYIMS